MHTYQKNGIESNNSLKIYKAQEIFYLGIVNHSLFGKIHSFSHVKKILKTISFNWSLMLNTPLLLHIHSAMALLTYNIVAKESMARQPYSTVNVVLNAVTPMMTRRTIFMGCFARFSYAVHHYKAIISVCKLNTLCLVKTQASKVF